MKINQYKLFFICENDLSQPIGGTYHVKELAEALHKKIPDITLIIPNYTRKKEQLILPGIKNIVIINTGHIPIIKWMIFYLISTIYTALHTIKSRKRVIVYSREMPLNIFLPLILKTLNIPYFIEVNGFLLGEISQLKSKFTLINYYLTHFLEKINFKLSTGIITVSEQLKSVIQTHHRITPDKITTVYNGVNLTVDKVNKTRENFAEYFKIKDPLIIGFLGSCYPYHDIDLLIDCANDILKTNPRFRFVIAGDGEMLPEWKSKVSEKNLTHFFYFPGYIKKEKIHKILNSFDVCYSLYNGGIGPGMKIFEYLATGKPVLYTDTPENRKLFKDFNNILWVKEHDKLSLLTAIKKMSDDPKKYYDSNARKKVIKKFSWDNTAQNILKTIERTLIHRQIIS